MNERPKIAVMASGEGTTTEALIEGVRANVLRADIDIVVTNNSKAGVLERVARFNEDGMDISALIMNRKRAAEQEGLNEFSNEAADGEQTPRESAAIARELARRGITLIVMLGYKKKVADPLLSNFTIINSHSGLLPETKGLYGIHIQEFALAQSHVFTGQTLHHASPEYDEGDEIARHFVRILPTRRNDPALLFNDVQATEKFHIAQDVDIFLSNMIAQE